MENENEVEFINKNNNFEIFRPDYENQNIKNNQNFINWENSIFKKYGNDAKLFKCTKDNIYFYTSNKDCIDYPYYVCHCPECNYYVCYYCSARTEPRYSGFGQCCIRRRLYYLFYEDGLEYIKPDKRWNFDKPTEFNGFPLVMFLLPFINMVYTIGAISALLFYKMEFYDGNDFNCYENRIKNNVTTFLTFFIVNALFAVVLSIPFFFYNIFVLIILWLISIPFKLIPVKFVAGVITRGMAG
jgi:hypothetical protein